MADFTDTHTHLYDEAFDADADEVVRQSIVYGVGKMILPNVDSSTIGRMRQGGVKAWVWIVILTND